MHLNSHFHFLAFAILLSSPLAVKSANAQEQPGAQQHDVTAIAFDRYAQHIQQRMNALHAEINYRTHMLTEEATRNRRDLNVLMVEYTQLKQDHRALQSRMAVTEALLNNTRNLFRELFLRVTVLEQTRQRAQQPTLATIMEQQSAEPSAPAVIIAQRGPRVQPSASSRRLNSRPFLRK